MTQWTFPFDTMECRIRNVTPGVPQKVCLRMGLQHAFRRLPLHVQAKIPPRQVYQNRPLDHHPLYQNRPLHHGLLCRYRPLCYRHSHLYRTALFERWVSVLLIHPIVIASPKRIVINHTQLLTIRFGTFIVRFGTFTPKSEREI